MKNLLSFELKVLDMEHRRFFMSIFLLIGSILSTLIASSYLLHERYSDTYISEVLIIYALFNLLMLYFNRKEKVFREYIILFSAVALVLEVSFAAWFQLDNPIRLLWFAVPITLVLYIASNLTSVIIISLSFFSIGYFVKFINHGSLNVVTLTDSLAIIITLLILMLFIRYRYHKDIRSLNKLNAEMNRLNQDLDRRIKLEIAKHNEKEKMLLYQSRMAQMGELLSMIAHQWRQPLGTLSAINMQIDFSVKIDVDAIKSEEDKQELVDRLSKNTHDIDVILQNLSQTIEDFSDFYKPDKALESSSMKEIVEQALGLVSGACELDDIELILDLNSNSRHDIYKNELIHVVVNFINNARDQFKTKSFFKPQITVRTFDEGERSVIEVYDNAGGIPQEYMEKIFEPYFSTKEEKNGTGLGLYMAKLLIEQHNNGMLNARNVEDGACFSIVLK